MRRALAISEASADKADPDTALSLGNLGLLLQDLGKFDEAEALMRRAVEILVTFQTTTGYRHRTMEKTEGYYRELRRKMGDTEEVAEEKLRKVSKPIPVK